MAINSKSTYESYFTSLLAAHVDITTSVIGYDQFVIKKTDWTHGQWYAVIGDYEATINSNTADNFAPAMTGSVTLIKHQGDAPVADTPGIEAEAEAIAHTIISRMRRDMRAIPRLINFRQCRISFIDQKLTGGYAGARLEVDIVHNINMAFDASKWSDS